MKENVIMWQKWIDPFAGEEITEPEHDPYLGEILDDADITYKELPDNIKYAQQNNIKVIATPMGIIPINENTLSSKIFNLWVGHTNFNISQNIAATIEQTEGVETLDIFTRYRFRISVGKAFDDSAVMRNINKRVYKELQYD
jgi:hypothetical protein